MRIIDAHIHVNGDHSDCLALLDQLDMKWLNVCVAHDSSGTWRQAAATYARLAQDHPRHYAWCTTFDPPAGEDPDYADRVIAGLAQDFKAGAVACKFWKNIGMDLRKPDGEFLMIDDPIFAPIYTYLAAEGKPALMHIAEPLECWQPLDENGVHYGYYSQHPEWHMYNKQGYPSHQALMDARDHVLAQFPNLRVIGAHLGSLEYDVAELAKRLDHYPNFAVDTSARMADLAHQPSPVVRRFFLEYPDRILFGTDVVHSRSMIQMPDAEREAYVQSLARRYETAFAYYAGDDSVCIRGRDVQGLGLPEDVLEKFYHANAERWYPGV